MDLGVCWCRHTTQCAVRSPTLVLPLLYVWIMFSAPCFTFSSMASCFSSPAMRLRLVAEQAGPPAAPGDSGASAGKVGTVTPEAAALPEQVHSPAWERG